MTPAGRLEAAITLLAAIIETPQRPADGVANEFFRMRRFIGAGDRRDVSTRVWSVLRARSRLGWWLDRLGLEQTPALLIAASLMLEGWTADDVAGAFSGGRYAPTVLAAADLARLRPLQGATLVHPEMDDPTRLELPAWLVPRLQARLGSAFNDELAALEREAPLDLRVNLLKGTREDALTALRAEGLEVTPTRLSPWGMRIIGRRPITSGAAFRSGLVEIQDEGSQMLASLVDAKPGMRVLDYCAGAGGKTLAIAATMNNRGQLVACDVSAARLDSAAIRLRRAGVHNAECHLLTPGDKWVKRRGASFDRVLVDAPCTGTGTWRRNPDARLRLTEQDLTELVAKQQAILQTAATLVKPGGRLIYATCSLLPDENEDQIALFLTRNPGYRQQVTATLVLTPYRHGTDGFYGVVLDRVA